MRVVYVGQDPNMILPHHDIGRWLPDTEMDVPEELGISLLTRDDFQLAESETDADMHAARAASAHKGALTRARNERAAAKEDAAETVAEPEAEPAAWMPSADDEAGATAEPNDSQADL